MRTKRVPEPLVVYELDDHDEATGEHEFYCSEACWELGQHTSFFGRQSFPKPSTEHPPGTQCCRCGEELIAKAEGR